MPDSTSSIARLAGRFIAFASTGTINTTQVLATVILEETDGADPALVAEETLCLVSMTTLRAAEFGLSAQPELAAAVLPVLFEYPLTYRDYLVGSSVIAASDPSLADPARHIYARLQRTRSFYETHLRAGEFPGSAVLPEKMLLWMGRVSPPGLPNSPQQRFQRLGLLEPLLIHAKVILAYGKQKENVNE